MSSSPTTPLRSLMVYPSECVVVTSGANFGDAISFADELILDDIYQIDAGSKSTLLSLTLITGTERFKVSAETDIGTPGNTVHLDCALTLMAPDGTTFEAMIFVEVEDKMAIGIYMLPLADVYPKTDYRLVGMTREGSMKRLAQAASVSFTKGTHITKADGKQVPIEDLKPGDMILTRNNGPQELQWVGQDTTRAVGDFAPVLIRQGAMNNTRDLLISPDHRLFVYQRTDKLGAGRKQVMIKARHLVNGDTVVRQEGGFVDYYQLLFNNHYIVYAEGIAAESMLVDDRTSAALPGDLATQAHDDSRTRDIEVTDVKDSSDLARKLREASSG